MTIGDLNRSSKRPVPKRAQTSAAVEDGMEASEGESEKSRPFCSFWSSLDLKGKPERDGRK